MLKNTLVFGIMLVSTATTLVLSGCVLPKYKLYLDRCTQNSAVQACCSDCGYHITNPGPGGASIPITDPGDVSCLNACAYFTGGPIVDKTY